MDKFFKTISYLIACTVVFLLLINVYKSPVTPDRTNTAANQNVATVYFLDLNETGNTTCEANGVVQRTLSDKNSLGRTAVEFLLKGLTKEEVDGGLGSAINPKATIQKFEIKNSTAYIDFNSELNPNIDDSCGAVAVKSQIEKTLKTVSGVKDVVISVNGETQNILEP